MDDGYTEWLNDLRGYVEHVDARLQLSAVTEAELREGFASGETTAEFAQRVSRRHTGMGRARDWRSVASFLFVASGALVGLALILLANGAFSRYSGIILWSGLGIGFIALLTKFYADGSRAVTDYETRPPKRGF